MTLQFATGIIAAMASYKDCFKMPAATGKKALAGRLTTITNAFVNALLPSRIPSESEIAHCLEVFLLEPHDLRCVYCGAAASEWDHLRPIVSRRRPTGFFSEIANLVPACGKCNQSKGAQDWESWMRGNAKGGLKARKVPDIEERITRLKRYDATVRPTKLQFTKSEKAALEVYWQNLDKIEVLLKESQDLADKIKPAIERELAGPTANGTGA